MKSEEAVPRYPHLNAVRDELNRLKIMWCVCCGSPLIYLFAASLILENCFDSPDKHGFWPVSAEKFKNMLIGFAGVAGVLQIALLVIRAYYNKQMRGLSGNLTELFRIYTRRTCVLIATSECAIVLGFILFLIQGRLDVLLAFSVLGMVYYAQSYPSERGLGLLTKPR